MQGSRKGRALLLSFFVVGCSGPSEGKVSFSDGPGTSVGDGGGAAEAGSGAQTVFINEVLPALAICQTCHVNGNNNAPIYFNVDGAVTYATFKSRGFDQGTSLLFTKGKHTGPALTADQVTVLNKWIGLEGGTPAVFDAGAQ